MYSHSSLLAPITPPSNSIYDGVAIVQPHSDYAVEAAYEEDSISASTCRPYSNTTASLPFLAPPSVYSMPSPYVLTVPHSVSHRSQSSVEITTPSLTNEEAVPTREKMDMGMAATGTEAAQAGIHTPLATYTAQTVVWLWHGTPAPVQTITNTASKHSSPLLNSPNPFEVTHSTPPLNPLQIAPTAQFIEFVERMLKITMVSHSVTLVALLYIYRLKMRNAISGVSGSETRPFIVSLILGNKYLDDNTYTNATWAELSGIDLKELNRMEAEFLRGLGFSLSVDKTEYQHWRNLLDGFISARRREAAHAAAFARQRPSWSPTPMTYTPLQTALPYLPAPAAVRARSASPGQSFSPTYVDPAHTYTYVSPSHRKRTALDAFEADGMGGTMVYEQMRLPPRKAHFGSVDMGDARTAQATTPSDSLARSSSLSRQIARLPGESSRRGSMSHVFDIPHHNGSADLRHTAALHWHNEGYGHEPAWDGPTALVAPYERSAHPAVVPPEHLMFYSLAADAHPGYDGAPRKAILRYQHPATQAMNQPPAPSTAYPAYVPQDAYGQCVPSYPPTGYGYAIPQPAQFANAGPPGYAYDAPVPTQYDTGLGISGLSNIVSAENSGIRWDERYLQSDMTRGPSALAAAPNSTWKARSQWSSPLARTFEPQTWQHV